MGPFDLSEIPRHHPADPHRFAILENSSGKSRVTRAQLRHGIENPIRLDRKFTVDLGHHNVAMNGLRCKHHHEHVTVIDAHSSVMEKPRAWGMNVASGWVMNSSLRSWRLMAKSAAGDGNLARTDPLDGADLAERLCQSL